MRVMVWNVWWRFGGNWRRREESIVATLDTYRPDVLGLVESWSGEGTDQPRRLAAPGGMHASWVPTSLPPPFPYEEQDGAEVGVGLVSRWPIRAAERQELPNEQRGGPEVDHELLGASARAAKNQESPAIAGNRPLSAS